MDTLPLNHPMMTGYRGHPHVKTPHLDVFIFMDDMGYGDMGCYGKKVIQTPVMDRIAA